MGCLNSNAPTLLPLEIRRGDGEHVSPYWGVSKHRKKKDIFTPPPLNYERLVHLKMGAPLEKGDAKLGNYPFSKVQLVKFPMEKAELLPFQIGMEENLSEATLPSHLPYTSRLSSAFKAVMFITHS